MTAAETPDPYAEEYRGPGVLARGAERVAVQVALAGHLEPLDGRYHWYGRVTADDSVAGWLRQRTPVSLTLPGGEPSAAQLTELDPWGNVRITGVGAPPFALETLEEIEST